MNGNKTVLLIIKVLIKYLIMKRLIAYVVFVFILNIENNFSQCGALRLSIEISKRLSMNFNKLSVCHRILGDLLIENTDITNLDSLYVIDTIDYYLSLTNNPQLESIFEVFAILNMYKIFIWLMILH